MATEKKKGVKKPYRLTAETAEKIRMMVLMGVRPAEAAMANGVSRETWYRCKDYAEVGDNQQITQWMEDIMIAEADFISRKEAQMADVPDWKAALAILKARRPEVYGDKIQQTISQPDQQAAYLDKDELIEEAKRRGLPVSIFGKKG
jgi:predicted DNA-binding protein (UPF0251 family)